MGNSAIQYETRATIEARLEQARQMRAIHRPGLAAYWPFGLYLCVAALVLVGASINAALNRPDGIADQGTTAALRRDAPDGQRATRRAAMRTEPMGGSAGISQASAVLDPEEARRRLCTTAESCEDIALPRRSERAWRDCEVADRSVAAGSSGDHPATLGNRWK